MKSWLEHGINTYKSLKYLEEITENQIQTRELEQALGLRETDFQKVLRALKKFDLVYEQGNGELKINKHEVQRLNKSLTPKKRTKKETHDNFLDNLLDLEEKNDYSERDYLIHKLTNMLIWDIGESDLIQVGNIFINYNEAKAWVGLEACINESMEYELDSLSKHLSITVARLWKCNIDTQDVDRKEFHNILLAYAIDRIYDSAVDRKEDVFDVILSLPKKAGDILRSKYPNFNQDFPDQWHDIIESPYES